MDKIICAGKNYLEHAQEMGDGIPDKPVLFFKPPSSALQTTQNGTIQADFLKDRGSLHHECEIVLKVAEDLVSFDAVTIGLDMTLRDLQSECKKKGQPWEIAKAFRHSALLGPWIDFKKFPNYLEKEFSLKVNGELRQKGFGKEMRFSPEQCLAHAKHFFDVKKGDLLFTGTPKGAAAILPGDTAELHYGEIQFSVKWN